MNKLISVILILLSPIFLSGIIRHDVKEQKYLKLGAEPQFECVGQVLKDTTPAGSCVLITDRYVLSAMHVFIEHEFKWDTVSYDGKEVVVNRPISSNTGDITTYNFRFKEKIYSGKKMNFKREYFDSISAGSYDIVLIELTEEVSDIIPAVLNTQGDELYAEVTGVGYGASGIANKKESVGLFNKKIAGENIVDSMAGLKINNKDSKLYCDFDSPQNNKCNKTGSAQPCALEYICSGGDSGGGLFRKTKTGWELVGICAGSGVEFKQFQETGYYGQIMSWTRISVFSSWISNLL